MNKPPVIMAGLCLTIVVSFSVQAQQPPVFVDDQYMKERPSGPAYAPPGYTPYQVQKTTPQTSEQMPEIQPEFQYVPQDYNTTPYRPNTGYAPYRPDYSQQYTPYPTDRRGSTYGGYGGGYPPPYRNGRGSYGGGYPSYSGGGVPFSGYGLPMSGFGSGFPLGGYGYPGSGGFPGGGFPFSSGSAWW